MKLIPQMSPLTARIVRLASTGMMVGALVGLPTVYGLAAHAPARGIADASQIEDRPISDAHDLAPGTIAKARDGMFYAQIRINGTSKRCLVDTGASAMVLDDAQAKAMGVSGSEGQAGHLITAGGTRSAVRTRVEAVELAGRTFRSVPAILVRGGGTQCLVGQDMLARLDKVEIHADELVLR